MDKSFLFIKQGDHELVFNERIALLNEEDLRLIFKTHAIKKNIALFLGFFNGDPRDAEVSMSEIEDAEFNDYKIYKCSIPLAKKRKLRSSFNLKPITMPMTDNKEITFIFNVEGYQDQWNIQISIFISKVIDDEKA